MNCTHKLSACDWCCHYETLCCNPQEPFDCEVYDELWYSSDQYRKMYDPFYKKLPDDSKFDHPANWE